MIDKVKATEDFQAYWNYGTWNLAKDQVVTGAFAEHLLVTGCPVVALAGLDAPAPAAPAAPATAGDGKVPSGAVKDVLAWVGDDPGRAARALEAEHLRKTPRGGVISGLDKLVPPAPAADDAVPEPAVAAETDPQAGAGEDPPQAPAGADDEPEPDRS